MGVVCAERACVRPTSADTCRAYEKHQVARPGAVIEFSGWNHDVIYNLMKKGYWCMPACILEGNIHPKMILSHKMPDAQEMCKQYAIHGRCGIDFNP